MLQTILVALVSAWTACWIGHPTEDSPVLRKNITIERPVSNATLKVCGLGFYEFFIDSKKVGDAVLAPNESSYSRRGKEKTGTDMIMIDDGNFRDFRVLYNTFDVTKAISPEGGHSLEAILGTGFYATDANRFVSSYGRPCFICELEITYGDGTVQTILSDTSWKTRRSPIVQNDLFLGETYDARIAGADEPWIDAVAVKGPDGRLVPQTGPYDRVIRTFRPSSIRKLPDGRWEVVFPEYMTGWVRLNDFTLAEGKEIVIEFPIEVDGNGIYRYIGDGKHCRSYAPRFCFWAFDKAIVSGWEGELKPGNIVAEMVHSDVAPALDFKCSSQLVNDIQDMWRRTAMCNMHFSELSDCPHREKGPYTGDGQLSCVTVMHNYDTRDFYRQWMSSMRDCQDVNTGYVPNGAPWHPGCGGGAAWGAAMNIIPWEHYMHYGDKETLAENYEAMKMQLHFMEGWRLPDGTARIQYPSRGKPLYWMNLGDWCPPYGLVGERLVHTFYLWRCADYTAKAASVLGHNEDASRYAALRDDVARAFNEAFWDEAGQTYRCEGGTTAADNYGTGEGGGCGDGSNIYALALGVPPERLEKVRTAVKKELEYNDGHFNTGMFGLSLFFEVLCDNGMTDEAFVAMTKRDYPSFGKMLDEGPGTMWEQWNGKDSRCHPFGGGALVWLYRRLAGVVPLEPGYSKVLVHPYVPAGLDWVDFSMDTPHGRIAVKWKKRHDGTVKLDVKAPEGVEVVRQLPAEGSAAFYLHSSLQSGMVLQRNSDFVLWGTSEAPGTRIEAKASWSRERYSCRSGSDGKWELSVPVPDAIRHNPKQTIEVFNSWSSYRLDNLLVGDVWILAGQSNMGITMSDSAEKESIAGAGNDGVRYLLIHQPPSERPLDDWASYPMGGHRWSPMNPETAGWTSAIGYWFAEKINAGTGIPIGMINTCMGGTSIKEWLPADAYLSDTAISEAFKDKDKTPGVYYNSKVHPILNYACKGFIWYQGEDDWQWSAVYARTQEALMRVWRQRMNCADDAPFYYVQLAPYALGMDWKEPGTFYSGGACAEYAVMREEQGRIRNMSTNTGMVVTMDIGDPGDIHPARKKPVGERLAALALHNDYGMPDVECLGPVYNGKRLEDGILKLSFDHAEGLTTSDGRAPVHFYVSLDGGDFEATDAGIHGEQVWLTNESVMKASDASRLEVRYAFLYAATTNLQNGAGLPAEPFRTDDRETVKYAIER